MKSKKILGIFALLTIFILVGLVSAYHGDNYYKKPDYYDKQYFDNDWRYNRYDSKVIYRDFRDYNSYDDYRYNDYKYTNYNRYDRYDNKRYLRDFRDYNSYDDYRYDNYRYTRYTKYDRYDRYDRYYNRYDYRDNFGYAYKVLKYGDAEARYALQYGSDYRYSYRY